MISLPSMVSLKRAQDLQNQINLRCGNRQDIAHACVKRMGTGWLSTHCAKNANKTLEQAADMLHWHISTGGTREMDIGTVTWEIGYIV